MTLDAFQSLDFERKLQATEEAVCISGRTLEGNMILLYQLAGFYIEVVYHKQKNFISDLRAFDDTNLLEPYLKKIKIALTY